MVFPVVDQGDMADSKNIAIRLKQVAQQWPERTAVIAPVKRNAPLDTEWSRWTFRDLDVQSDRLAAGLVRFGVKPGSKLVLFVPFQWEFITLTFALFKAGAVVVLIDPGMGRRNIFRCLEEVQPDGFVAIPIVHAVRIFKRSHFPNAKWNVTLGRRLFWGGTTYARLDSTQTEAFEPVTTSDTDAAAIIFTSGSTGPPKGVTYEHGMFDAQVELIQGFYGIEPGEVDLPGFPLFGLFNAAMGVTTVIPDMDPTKPAQVDPRKIVHAMEQHQVTQAFGSPAFWNRVGRYCEQHQITLPMIRRGLSAGGPVPVHVLQRMSQAFTQPGAELHTPYGATESLPVASIGSDEVLEQTAAQTRRGRGTCVGKPFPGIDVRVIPVTDGEVTDFDQIETLPCGEIGEIVVRGPSVTREYFNRPQATRLAKIPDGETFWHRIGDVGYLDPSGRLWFCGRKAHIVQTSSGPMYSVCCEAIFNEHPDVYRSALVGIGEKPAQTPAIVIEPEAGRFPNTPDEREQFRRELLELAAANELTRAISSVHFHRALPVDTRHNVKINREALAAWVIDQMP